MIYFKNDSNVVFNSTDYDLNQFDIDTISYMLSTVADGKNKVRPYFGTWVSNSELDIMGNLYSFNVRNFTT